MSDIVYLSPSTVALLDSECLSLLSGLSVEIIEEDLRPTTDGGQTYEGKYNNWLPEPKPRIRVISTTGTETLLFAGPDYTIDYANGEILLASTPAVGETIRADYYYSPMTDSVVESLFKLSVAEIGTTIRRTIDPEDVSDDYHAMVCKRLYTHVLENLMLEARNMFSVSVAGRSISKDQIVENLRKSIEANEKQLKSDINAVRLWPRANRFE